MMAMDPVERSVVRRTMGRLERNDLAVAMHNELGVDEAMFEAALDRHSLIFGDKRSIFALTSGFDERAAAGVLQDELVAEDLGHLAFDLDGAPVSHRGDRNRRKRRVGRGAPSMPVFRRNGADAYAERKDRDG
jgi:hypothetical protein